MGQQVVISESLMAGFLETHPGASQLLAAIYEDELADDEMLTLGVALGLSLGWWLLGRVGEGVNRVN